MHRVFARLTIACVQLAICLSIGCQSQPGPWGGQAYQQPSRETPTQQVVVTPGVRLPFEQRLPVGNQQAVPAANVGNQ